MHDLIELLIFDIVDLQLDNDLPRGGPANSVILSFFYIKLWGIPKKINHLLLLK